MQKKLFEILVQTALIVGRFWTILKLTPKSIHTTVLTICRPEIPETSRHFRTFSRLFDKTQMFRIRSWCLKYRICFWSKITGGICPPSFWLIQSVEKSHNCRSKIYCLPTHILIASYAPQHGRRIVCILIHIYCNFNCSIIQS